MNTLWLFNIAMENCPFIDDFPIKTSIYKGFPDGMRVITLNGKSDFVISQPWPALRIPAFILFRSRWTKGGVLLWRKVTWAVAASLLGWRRSSLWDVFTYTCRAIRKYRRYTSRTCISYILPGKKKSIYHTHIYVYIYMYIISSSSLSSPSSSSCACIYTYILQGIHCTTICITMRVYSFQFSHWANARPLRPGALNADDCWRTHPRIRGEWAEWMDWTEMDLTTLSKEV